MFFIFLWFQFIVGCGVVTHNVVANNALDRYNIDLNLYAFQADAAFPDFGYNCPLKEIYTDLPATSEAAHWLPFQYATVKYLHLYPNKILEGFLYGVVSHATADILWHSLGIIEPTGQGFIQAFANANFNAKGKPYNHEIHLKADIDGEFVSASQYDLSFLKEEWTIPSHELSEIFHSMNLTIPAWVIESCMGVLYAEVQFFRNFPTELIYPEIIGQYDFLIDEFSTWWLGGINSMTDNTLLCWDTLTDWLNGNLTNICKVQSTQVVAIQQDNIRPEHVTVQKDNMQSNKIFPQQRSDHIKCSNIKPSKILSSKDRSFGRSVTFYNGEIVIALDSYTYYYPSGKIYAGSMVLSLDSNLIIGNPGKIDTPGRVTIMSNGKSMTIYGNTTRFGSRLFKGDCNADVHDDLIVTDPYVSQVWCFVYPQWNLHFKLTGPQFTWFGYSVIIHNNILIIGAPYHGNDGIVYGYDIDPLSLKWNITGTSQHEKFGFSLAVDNNTLAVSSPSKIQDGLYQAGQITFYSLIDRSPLQIIRSTERFSQFGYDIGFSDDRFYMTSPGIGIVKFKDMTLCESGKFGLSIYHNMTTLAIGSDGKVYLFDL